MTLVDRSRAALATGALALWVGGTDAMLKYLRPSMRPWLLAAAIGLIAVGLYGLLRQHHLAQPAEADHDHHRSGRPRIGWLLIVPIVVMILFGPQPMGDFAITRTPKLPPYAFDIAEYASDTGQSVPVLRFVDVLEGATDNNSDYLTSHDITLEGFVSRPEILGPGTFLFTRYLIACCAADAQPLSVIITGAPSIPTKGQWVNVTARLHSGPHAINKYGPEMSARKIEPVSEPSNTYETFRT